jgi:hypothetical protein
MSAELGAVPHLFVNLGIALLFPRVPNPRFAFAGRYGNWGHPTAGPRRPTLRRSSARLRDNSAVDHSGNSERFRWLDQASNTEPDNCNGEASRSLSEDVFQS